MIKLTKKQLKQEAEYNEAYYFTGNVYSYENIVYYINSLCYTTETGKQDTSELESIKNELLSNCGSNYFNSLWDLIHNIESIKHDSYKIDKIYYSAGVYGNNGQYHTIKLYNNKSIVAEYHIYY